MKTILENDQDYLCDISAPCFAMLSPEETDLVRASKTQVLFRKGDTLTKQGAFASYVLFLIEGIARQYIESDSNRNFNLMIVTPGEFVGLSAVFQKQKFAYSTMALTDCRAFLVEKDAITQVIRHNGDFGYNIIRKYCEQNNNLFEILNTLVNRQMNGRMAATLLYIDGLRVEHDEIFLALSRKDLAEFAGISMESAVKLLKIFESDGLIALNDKDIRIIDPKRLTEISQRG